MKLLNFNTAWAKPGCAIGKRVGRILAKADADLICLTEAFPALVSGSGHTITCDDRSGYVHPLSDHVGYTVELGFAESLHSARIDGRMDL